MAEPAVVVDGVWKKFRRGARHDSLRDLVPALLGRPFRRRRATELKDAEFWALRDLSFEVSRGEAVGIIGPNGAGKSTALKLLTRILRADRGTCRVNGRVGAVIEVAAGFHPDLTGRENVYMQGAIMGMRRTQVDAQFDEIVEFSGISQFIDTQVKRYSSGMQARLGFSVAAHMNPDVLIVDEVLSVGDISFQAKCIDRMRENIRRGTTLVFVSHNLQAVSSLCSRCIVLGAGRQLFDGPPDQGVSIYLSASQSSSTRYGSEARLRVVSADFRQADGSSGNRLRPHTPCELRVILECVEDTPPVTIGTEFERTRDLFYCYGASAEDLGSPNIAFVKGQRYEYVARFCAHMSRGHYRINLNAKDTKAARYFMVAENVAHFTVDEEASYDGVVDVSLQVDVRDV